MHANKIKFNCPLVYFIRSVAYATLACHRIWSVPEVIRTLGRQARSVPKPGGAKV